jgi:hypothetical protein
MSRKIFIGLCTVLLLSATAIQAQYPPTGSKTPPADLDQRINNFARKLGWYIGTHSDTIVQIHKPKFDIYFNDHPSLNGKLKPNETISFFDQTGNQVVFMVKDSILIGFARYFYNYKVETGDFEKSKKAQTAVFDIMKEELGYIPEPEIRHDTRLDQDAMTYNYKWRSKDFTFGLFISHDSAGSKSSKCVLSFLRTADLQKSTESKN